MSRNQATGSNQRAPRKWVVPAISERLSEVRNPHYQKSGDFIYFLQAEDVGLIKIGTTRHVIKRIAGLQTSCPTRLNLIGLIDGNSDLESQIHHEFRSERRHGEWFYPSERLLWWISILDDLGSQEIYRSPTSKSSISQAKQLYLERTRRETLTEYIDPEQQKRSALSREIYSLLERQKGHGQNDCPVQEIPGDGMVMVVDAARILNISTGRMFSLISRNSVDKVRVGLSTGESRYYVSKSDLLGLFHRLKTSPNEGERWLAKETTNRLQNL